MRTLFPTFFCGLAALTLLAGCTVNTDKGVPGKATPIAKKAAEEEHDDHGPGPHGGTLVEWGDSHKYHLEFTVDHKKQQATVYVLGPDAKKPAPIKADKLTLNIKEPAFQVDLKADPEKADPAGQASRFVGTHEKLGKEQEFEGSISGEVDGKPYVGDFKEEPEAKEEKKK